jgi:hypothetical protein
MTYVFVLAVVDVYLESWMTCLVGTWEFHSLRLLGSVAHHPHIETVDVRLSPVSVCIMKGNDFMSHDVISSLDVAGNLDPPGHVVLSQDVVCPDSSFGIKCCLMNFEKLHLRWVLGWTSKAAHILYQA